VSLEVGIERTDEFTVADRATVGFEVCVKHVGAAAEGTACTVHARLQEIVDGRKLRFAVEVRDGERTIGVGTHERRVVDRTSFGS
jgi:fluoroacetyl-CoA thioesterase